MTEAQQKTLKYRLNDIHRAMEIGGRVGIAEHELKNALKEFDSNDFRGKFIPEYREHAPSNDCYVRLIEAYDVLSFELADKGKFYESIGQDGTHYANRANYLRKMSHDILNEAKTVNQMRKKPN